VPIPAGFITGCAVESPTQGLSGAPLGVVTGCVTGIQSGNGTTRGGTLNATSPTTFTYTAPADFTGVDTFTYEAVGVDAVGNTALQSGPITMTVNVAPPVPTLSPWAAASMMVGLLLVGARALRGRFV